MPRQARLDAPGTLHHVMIRGTEGESVFRRVRRVRRDVVECFHFTKILSCGRSISCPVKPD